MIWIEEYVDVLFDDKEPVDLHEFAVNHDISDIEVEKIDSALLYEPVMRRIRRECLLVLPQLIEALKEKGLKGDPAVIRLILTICKPESTKEKIYDTMETYRNL